MDEMEARRALRLAAPGTQNEERPVDTERTDFERFSEPPAPLLVVLGGKEFAVAIQRKGKTAAFRKKLRLCLASADEIAALVRTVSAAADQRRNVDVGDLPIESLVSMAINFLGDGANTLLDLIYEYDPALSDAREWIDEHAYDSEVCAALVEIVKVVFGPFLNVLLPGVAVETSSTGASTKAEG